MLKKSILRLVIFTALMVGSFSAPTTLDAQCPMCRMSAEQNLKDGGTAGKGLNAGILYMFAMPYLIVGGMAFWWYRNRKKNEATDLAESLMNDSSRLN